MTCFCNNISLFHILFISCSIFPNCFFAQSSSESINETYIEELAAELVNGDEQEEKPRINELLKKTLKVELNKEKVYQFSFSKVESMSILTPEDSSFRIFNWSIPKQDGSYGYECGILKRNQYNELSFFYLEPPTNRSDSIKWDQTVLQDNQWSGGLFYQLITKKTELQTYYVLLSWDGNNRLTTKKTIEVLWFDAKGKIRFGAPLFKQNGTNKYRIIFEYSSEQAMNLSYKKEKDWIEFNQLLPLRPDLEGIYEYYYPDIVKDAYKWEGKNWTLMKEVNLDEGSRKEKKKLEKAKQDIIIDEIPLYKTD